MKALDTAGATASLVCAVHCATMPLIITLLPLVGLRFLADDRTEWLLFALSVGLGLSSLGQSYWKEHRSCRAFALLAPGICLIALGHLVESRFGEAKGMGIVVSGGLIVAAAHYVNHTLCCACRRCNQVKKEQS